MSREGENPSLEAPGAGEQLHRIEAEEDQEVGPVEATRIGRGPGEAADGEAIGVGDRALGLVGGHHRAAERLREHSQRRTRRPPARFHAGDDQGPCRGGEQAARLRQRDQVVRLVGRLRRPPLAGGGLGGGRSRRRREIELHGARRVRRRRIEQRVDLAQPAAGRRFRVGLDQWCEEGLLIETLVQGVVARRGLRERIGDEEHGRPLQRGIGDAVDGAGGTRPHARHRHAGRAAELGGDRRHQGGRGLAVGEHEVDVLCGERIDDIEAAGPARHAEGAAHAPRPARRRESPGQASVP